MGVARHRLGSEVHRDGHRLRTEFGRHTRKKDVNLLITREKTMQSCKLRVLGILITVCCFNTLGCNTDAIMEDINAIFVDGVKAAATDIGTALVEAAVDATFD